VNIKLKKVKNILEDIDKFDIVNFEMLGKCGFEKDEKGIKTVTIRSS
jgi:hypothetical protein